MSMAFERLKSFVDHHPRNMAAMALLALFIFKPLIQVTLLSRARIRVDLLGLVTPVLITRLIQHLLMLVNHRIYRAWCLATFNLGISWKIKDPTTPQGLIEARQTQLIIEIGMYCQRHCYALTLQAA